MQFAQDIEDQVDSQTVEPLLESYSVYSIAVVGIITGPFVLLYINIFYEETGICGNYGIKQNDLAKYFLFAIIIIVFQSAVDVIIMNVLELWHTWPILDY